MSSGNNLSAAGIDNKNYLKNEMNSLVKASLNVLQFIMVTFSKPVLNAEYDQDTVL